MPSPPSAPSPRRCRCCRSSATRARLSFPEVSACLLLGWTIVLLLPHVHQLSERARGWALTSGFAFSVQALFFAPHVAPFLYFRF